MKRLLMGCLALSLVACGTNPSRDDEGRNPAHINAELGLSYMQSGNYDLAMIKLKKALAEEPYLPEAHHYLAELYRRTGNEEGAMESYRQALRFAPKDPQVRGNYALYRCELGDYALAEEAFEETIELYRDRRRFGVHEQAAACALKAQNNALAERHLRAALSGSPKSAFALFHMASLMYEDGEFLKARAFMQRLDLVHQGSVESLELGRDIEQALHNPEGAEAYRKRIATAKRKSDDKGSDRP